MTGKVRLLHIIVILAWGAFVPVQEAVAGNGNTPAILRPIMALKHFIDSSAVRGVDRRFIESPKRPWQVIVRGNVNQTDLQMKSVINGGMMFADVQGDLQWEPRIKTSPSTYVGIWAGYRGYGFGYSRNVAGDKGNYLTFGITGGTYGANVRIHHFKTHEPEVKVSGFMPDWTEETISYGVSSPIDVHTVIADAYYLFNGRHFSYAAAYDHSVFQLRSAGSVVAGAMYFQSTIDYSDPSNAELMLWMGDIGRIKQWQASLGVGYAYNWVPAKGWLVNAMVMPMLTAYNRLKVWRYDSNYRQMALDEKIHEDDELRPEDYKVWVMEERRERSDFRLTFDARFSLTYQWDRYFINSYCQYNHFNFKQNSVSGKLNDWLAYLQLGIRL